MQNRVVLKTDREWIGIIKEIKKMRSEARSTRPIDFDKLTRDIIVGNEIKQGKSIKEVNVHENGIEIIYN